MLIRYSWILVFLLLLSGCGSGGEGAVDDPADTGGVASIEIDERALLLSRPGDSRLLTAVALDANGIPGEYHDYLDEQCRERRRRRRNRGRDRGNRCRIGADPGQRRRSAFRARLRHGGRYRRRGSVVRRRPGPGRGYSGRSRVGTRHAIRRHLLGRRCRGAGRRDYPERRNERSGPGGGFTRGRREHGADRRGRADESALCILLDRRNLRSFRIADPCRSMDCRGVGRGTPRGRLDRIHAQSGSRRYCRPRCRRGYARAAMLGEQRQRGDDFRVEPGRRGRAGAPEHPVALG